jgi:hypothetical protein
VEEEDDCGSGPVDEPDDDAGDDPGEEPDEDPDEDPDGDAYGGLDDDPDDDGEALLEFISGFRSLNTAYPLIPRKDATTSRTTMSNTIA